MLTDGINLSQSQGCLPIERSGLDTFVTWLLLLYSQRIQGSSVVTYVNSTHGSTTFKHNVAKLYLANFALNSLINEPITE